MPATNDPRFIVPRAKPEHARKTDGDPAAPLSGDKAKIAKVKRLEKKRATRLVVSVRDSEYAYFSGKPKRRIPSRPWPKGRKMERRK